MPDPAGNEGDKVRAQSVEIVVKNNADPPYKTCDTCLGPFRTPTQHCDHTAREAWLSERSTSQPDKDKGKAVGVVDDADRVSVGKCKGKARTGVEVEVGVSAGITDQKVALASQSPSSTAAKQQTKSVGSSSSEQEESGNVSLTSLVASISLVDPGSERGSRRIENAPVDGVAYPGVTVAKESYERPARPVVRKSLLHPHVDPGEAHWRNFEVKVFKDSSAQAGPCSGAGMYIIRDLMARLERENRAIGRDQQPVDVPEEGQIAVTERADPNLNSQQVQVPGFSIDITGTDRSLVPRPEEHRMEEVRFGGSNVPRGP